MKSRAPWDKKSSTNCTELAQKNSTITTAPVDAKGRRKIAQQAYHFLSSPTERLQEPMPGHVYFYIYAAIDGIIGWRWGVLNPGVLKHAHLQLRRAIFGRAFGYPVPLTVES